MSDNRFTNRREVLGGIATAGGLGIAGCLGDDDDDDVDPGDDTADDTATDDDDDDVEQLSWALGTSAEGSSSFRIGATWTEYFRREGLFDRVDIEAIVTEGTGATYRMVDGDEIEMGGTTSQLLDDSPDEGPYEDTPLTDFDPIRQIRGYMGFFNFGLVNLDAGVEGWDDLEGRPVAISSAGSGTRPPVEWVVDQEIGLDNIDNRYMTFSDIPGALRGGQVDAAFTWTVNETTPQGWFEEIDATVNWAPLELSQSTIDALDELEYATYFELDEATVGEFASHYTGPIDSFTLTYIYVAKAGRDADAVYEATRLMYEYAEELLDQDPVMGFFPNPDLFLGGLHPEVPLHEGAYRYYDEEGLLDDYNVMEPPEL